jgi:septal ring factor EnvC (AmiA/AmiB activator)
MSDEVLSEVERLRQQLHDTQARAEAAEERAEAAQARAEAAGEHAEAAGERAEAAEERSEHTALPTFLQLCHTLFSEPLRVQTNRSLTTKGSITSPRGKKHPTYLRPWHD